MANTAPVQLVDGTADQDGPDTILTYSINIAEQEKPPVLPIGEYISTIRGVQKKYGKDSGRPYLTIKFVIDPDSLPADFVEANGAQEPVNVYYMLFGCEDTPKSRFAMHSFCAAIGAPMSDRINVAEFMDQEARIQVEHQKDLVDGSDQARVRRVLPV
jgi:hypothetical protein